MFRFESKTKPKSSKTSIIISLILVSFLIVGGFIWAAKKLNNPQKISFKKTNGLNSTNNQSQIDSDNDGLFDWQEQLFGTDKHNPDTDNDGTKDGDEIKQNRDPLKPGPDDKSPNLITKNQMFSQNSESEAPKTLTDKFALAISKQIIENLPNNISPNQIDSNFLEKQIKDTLSSNYATGNILQDFFTISLNNLDEMLNLEKDFNYHPIQIINDANQYFTIYSQIISKYFPYKNKNIFEIINNAFETNNFNEVKNLAQAYEDSAQEFKQIKPPQEYLEYHIEQIKLMLTMTKLLNLISDAENDPIAASLALKILPKTTQDYINLINKLKENVK